MESVGKWACRRCSFELGIGVIRAILSRRIILAALDEVLDCCYREGDGTGLTFIRFQVIERLDSHLEQALCVCSYVVVVGLR